MNKPITEKDFALKILQAVHNYNGFADEKEVADESKECFELAKKMAKQQVVGFIGWIHKNKLIANAVIGYWFRDGIEGQYTTEQLFDIYIRELYQQQKQ